jgi:hypothetical protein
VQFFSTQGKVVATFLIGFLELGFEHFIATVGWQLHIVLAGHD